MPFNKHIPWRVLTIEKTADKKIDIVYQYFLILIGEVLSTFGLVFFGCASLSAQYGLGPSGALSTRGQAPWIPAPDPYEMNATQELPFFTAAIYFGIVIALMLQIFYPISGGHMNPMVSISIFISGLISLPMLFWYIICQIIGAWLGYAIMIALLPHVAPKWNETAPLILWNQTNNQSITHAAYCCTYPALGVSYGKAFLIEFVAGIFLAFIVCSMVDTRNADKQDSMPIKVGLMIFVLAYLTAPYTGASLNSARTLGPALYTSCFKGLWIYMVAPNLAAFTTTLFYVVFLGPPPPEDAED